jgi:ferredoxin
MKVKVDQDTCIGSGNCEATAPAVFEVKNGKSQVKVDTVAPEQEERVKEAVDGCPVEAISIS